MSNLGSLWYTLGIKDLTDADLQKINKKIEKLGATIKVSSNSVKLPKGLKLELDPKLNAVTDEALAKAVEGKVMRVAITPLLTGFREAIAKATKENPPKAEVGVQETKLREIINRVLNKQGFMLNISTVNDNYSKAIQQKLNGMTYTVKIHADAKEIARSVHASLMQVQSRYFGLQVSKDILRNSIDQALMGKPFNIQIAVMHDQARRAVQNALNNARMVGKDDALAFQRLQTGELRAAQAELARLKASQLGARDAANAHASASINLGGALGSNIKIAGELGAAMASLYSIHAAKQFLSQVIEIGGELEHQKIALETIYGSGSKMQTLYGQIKGLARQSPFGVMDLTKNIKQLSAYGVAYNEVYDTAKRLADISAATSVDIQRLILAFGKTKNRTFLDGLEAKQFAYANIPIYDALSKKLTELEGKFVSVKDVMGRIKKREIGFDMVKEILWDMTDEGGKFYNMQEKLAGSVKTSWKLVRDNIELMFGEIAESRIGDKLKGIAEILQGLTRNWKTLGAVIGSGAAAFGIYKLAVIAHNVVAGKAISTAAKQHAGLKMTRYHANLAAMSYRSLTQAEEENYLASSGLAKIKGINVLWSKKLNYAEAEVLYNKKLLTREDILRLVALKKLSAAEAEKVLITRQMAAATDAETIATVQSIKADLAKASAVKKSKVALLQLRAGLAGVASSLRAFATAALPMAIIGTVVALWQRHSEEMKKAEEIGKNVFSSANDGADNLKKTLEELKPSQELSSLELAQGIEKMEEAIKDYSPTPIKDINDALVDQNGHLRTAAERYDVLRSKVGQLKDAYEDMRNRPIGGLSVGIEKALKSTKEGWFWDGMETNAKDYTNALKRRADLITLYATKHQRGLKAMVNAALNADKGFAAATAGMISYEEKLGFLIDNMDKYPAAVASFNAVAKEHKLKDVEGIGNISQIKSALKELESDTDKFIASINSRMNQMGWNPLMLNPMQKTELAISLKSLLTQMENAGDDAKAVIAKKLEETYGLVGMIMEDKIGPAMQEKFRNLASASTDESTRAAIRKLQYEGYANLSEAEQEIVKKLMGQAKAETMFELGILNDEMQKYLKANPLSQIITLSVAVDNKPSELAKELVAKHGYPGLTNSTDRLVRQWTKSGKMYESRNAAKESLQEVYSELEAAKREGGEVQKKAQEAYNEVWNALQYLGWTDLKTKDQGSNKEDDSKKDSVAESLKQRFKDIKDAWSEFQKWSKSEGREAAATRIGESGLVSTLPKEKIPQTVEQYHALVAELEDELRKAGINGHSQRESLLNDLLKQLLDIDKTVFDEQLKLTLDEVSKEAERQLADWNLFDKVRQATGNQDLAMSVAFGLNADAETDYPALVKKQFNDIAKALGHDITFDNTTLAQAKALGNDIAKAYQNTAKDLEKYAREQKDAIDDILSEYQSLQDKLAKIDADRERKIKIVGMSDLSDTEKAKLTQRINVESDYQKFTQSNEYLQFFGGIYALTLSQAQQIGDAIEQNLNRKLQAGAISADDYYKEIDRIRKQLQKLRNVKSNALTFMTEGLKGLNTKVQEENEAKQLETTRKIQELEEKVAEAKAKVKDIDDTEGQNAVIQAEAQLKAAKEELSIQEQIQQKLIANQMQMQKAGEVASLVANIAGGISDVFNTIRELAGSMGFDTDSNAWNTTAAAIDTLNAITSGVSNILQSLLNGNIGGIISGVFDTILTPFTIWNKLHDKTLQRDIEKSQKRYESYERLVTAIERKLSSHLGGYVDFNPQPGTSYGKDGAFGYERDLKKKQLEELKRQQSDMEKMKNKDKKAIEELKAQIGELEDEIANLEIEAANAIYGIDIKEWAETIGDALWDAFMKGEDALEAFDKAVADIMSNVVKNILKVNVLERAFQNTREWLASESGPMSDGILDAYEARDLWNRLTADAQKGMDSWNAAMNVMPEDLKKFLMDNYDKESKDGMKSGLQSLTEDTGDLIASYINAVRADTSVIRMNWDELLKSALPQMNVIAEAQLTAQRQIAENTLRNAVAAEAILASNENIYRLFSRVTQGVAKVYIQ